jgi:hypothetical protein
VDPEPTQNNSPEVRHIPFATTAVDLARAHPCRCPVGPHTMLTVLTVFSALNVHDEAELRVDAGPHIAGGSLCTPIRWRHSSCLGRDGIKPTQPARPRKITIGGAQRKPVFHRQRSQMSVWYKIAMYAGQREKLT